MGAYSFATSAWGKDAAEAFRSATEHALWEHGHGGYSGTIAEKNSFVSVPLPPRVTVAKMLDWISAAEDAGSIAYAQGDLSQAEEWLAVRKPGTIRDAQARVREAQRRLARARKSEAKFKREVGAHLALVERASTIYDDKWGPALCLEVLSPAEKAKYAKHQHQPQPKRGLRLYVFCGYASS